MSRISEISGGLDVHIAKQQSKKILREHTKRIIRNISKRINPEDDERVINPFQGTVYETIYKANEDTESDFVDSLKVKKYISLDDLKNKKKEDPEGFQHLSEVFKTLDISHDEYDVQLMKETVHETPVLTEEQQALVEKERIVERKLLSLMNQRDWMSRQLRDVEEKETELRILEIKLNKKEESATITNKIDTGYTTLEQLRHKLQTQEAAYVSRKEELAQEILLTQKRLKALRQKELNKKTKIDLFTKNQIAEFIDYVKNLIALQEYEKALKFHDIAQSMFLSAKLAKEDEERIKEILNAQYRRITIEKLKEEKNSL